MGLTGFPGRSFPDARRGDPPVALEATDRCGVRTRRVLAERAGDFFFLNGVLNRDSRPGAEGWSPLVFWACSAPPNAVIIITNISIRRAIRKLLTGFGGI